MTNETSNEEFNRMFDELNEARERLAAAASDQIRSAILGLFPDATGYDVRAESEDGVSWLQLVSVTVGGRDLDDWADDGAHEDKLEELRQLHWRELASLSDQSMVVEWIDDEAGTNTL